MADHLDRLLMGRPKRCNPCCESGGGTSVCTNCIDGVAPSVWEVTFSGVAGGTGGAACPSGWCTAANQTWRLLFQRQTGRCYWTGQVTDLPLCNGSENMYMTLSIGSGPASSWLLEIGTLGGSFGLVAVYHVNIPFETIHNCLVSRTLTRITSNTICTNWPATVVVSPAL